MTSVMTLNQTSLIPGLGITNNSELRTENRELKIV